MQSLNDMATWSKWAEEPEMLLAKAKEIVPYASSPPVGGGNDEEVKAFFERVNDPVVSFPWRKLL